MKSLSVAGGLVVLVLMSACAGSSLSPSSNDGSGATITGTAHSTSASALNSLTVRVVGTQLTTRADSAGQFTLANVPSGTVELLFTGPGVDARLSLGSVALGEKVTIVVQVNGTQVQLMDERHDEGDADEDDNEFDGVILSIAGQSPNLTLMIAGHQVQTNSATVVRRRGNIVGFDALHLQQEVEVEGVTGPGGIITATKITIEDDEDELQQVEVEGSLSALSAVSGCPSVTFSVKGQAFFANSATRFDKIACSALTNGMQVEVKGVREATGSVRATRVERDD